MADERMNESEFCVLLRERLPELRESLDKENYFAVDKFMRYAQRAIYDEDRARFEICVRLAEEAYLNGDKDLRASIDTIFMEDLEFVTPRRSHYWAWEMLPDCLKELYVAFWGIGKVPEKPTHVWKPPKRR
jgi:hypothetical protein